MRTRAPFVTGLIAGVNGKGNDSSPLMRSFSSPGGGARRERVRRPLAAMTPLVHGSQASPSPSPSASACPPLPSSGQLSTELHTKSPSVSPSRHGSVVEVVVVDVVVVELV